MSLASGVVLVFVRGALWFGAGVLVFIFILFILPAFAGSGPAFAESRELWLVLVKEGCLGLVQVVGH